MIQLILIVLFAIIIAVAPYVLLTDITVVYSTTLTNVLYFAGLIILVIYANYYNYAHGKDDGYYRRLGIGFLIWFILSPSPLLIINYFFKDNRIYSEYAIIKEKTAYKSRRTNTLIFSNNWECDYEDKDIYKTFKAGDSIKLKLQKGGLGMPIIVDYYREDLYLMGIEELKDKTYFAAFDLFTRSWELENNPDALWQIGIMYENGYHIKKNKKKAYKMYQWAYSEGSEKAKKDMRRLSKYK